MTTRPLRSVRRSILVCFVAFVRSSAQPAVATLAGRVVGPAARADARCISDGAIARHPTRGRRPRRARTLRASDAASGRLRRRGVAERLRALAGRSVTLQVGQERQLEVQLEPGRSQEAVVVRAETRPVTTVVDGVLSRRAIESLPLNGRNFLELALLVPGNAPTPVFDPTKTNSVLVASAGQMGRGGNITIDGQDNNDDVVGGPLLNLPIDAVQEFQIATNRFGADLGRSASSVINVVTRSGTNTLQGSAAIFARDEGWQALPATLDNEDEAPPFDRQQMSGAFGGPLRRDRLFWFGAGEYRHQDGAVLVGTRDTATRTITRRLRARAASRRSVVAAARHRRRVQPLHGPLRRRVGHGHGRQRRRARDWLGHAAAGRHQSLQQRAGIVDGRAARNLRQRAQRQREHLSQRDAAGGDGAAIHVSQHPGRRIVPHATGDAADAHPDRGERHLASRRAQLQARRRAAARRLVARPGRVPAGPRRTGRGLPHLRSHRRRPHRRQRPAVRRHAAQRQADAVAGTARHRQHARRRLRPGRLERLESAAVEPRPALRDRHRGEQPEPRRRAESDRPAVRHRRAPARSEQRVAARRLRVESRHRSGCWCAAATASTTTASSCRFRRSSAASTAARCPSRSVPATSSSSTRTTGRLPPFAPTLSNPFTGFILPGAGASGINIIDPHLQNPTVHEFHLGLEARVVGTNVRVDGHAQPGHQLPDRPDRRRGLQPRGRRSGPRREHRVERRTNYDALLVSVDRLSAGTGGARRYTLAKAFNYVNDDQIPFSNGPIDPNDLHREYGPTPERPPSSLRGVRRGAPAAGVSSPRCGRSHPACRWTS